MTTKKILTKVVKNGVEYEIEGQKVFIITEDKVTVSTDDTKGVSPYNTSYGYTNIDINANAGIKWVEGAIYSFVVDTEMVVASAYRNVRVRIGNGTYIPVKNRANSILAGSSYMTKGRTQFFVYKTVYETGGALHMTVDTSYSAMSVAEGKTGTATSGRVMRADYLKQIIEYYIGQNVGDGTITLQDEEGNELGSFGVNDSGDTTITIPAGGITSSNNTYEDIIHLSQAEYEALQNKDPNTLYSTPEDESGGFNPENEGEEGQFLVKTNTGYDWETVEVETGGIDHLEVSALVGEKYALTDKLFNQYTPTLANSSLDCNVGDTANNTEIHIQRIGNGVASDELKLYVKKVGSPGNLNIQVMEGIEVDISTSEAYWYGDSTKVLATGSISSSDITTSFQEITVSLNNSIGGIEGQLLDIVLSIPTVSSSNYIVVACDSTQWSEGFGYVSVNGNTMTRYKLMPYCISDGFNQNLLVKVDDIGVPISSLPLFSKTESGSKTLEGYYQRITWRDIYTIKNGTTTLSGTIIGKVNYSNYELWIRIVNGNTAVYSEKVTYSYGGQYQKTISFTNKTVAGGYIVQIGLQNNSYNDINAPYQYTLDLSGNGALYKTNTNKGKPRSLTAKEIGEKESITIFGIHSDNTRYNSQE